MTMIGKFITFEGGEGSGKSSIIHEVAAFVTSLGHEVLVSREPGGISISEQIREVILSKANTDMEPETEALLYAASRVQHLNKKVLPALKEGKVVILDRYIDSSLAYQGYARNLGIDEVLNINMYATKHMPDLTFFIDLSPEIGLARISACNREVDRLDLESLAFHERVYEGYKVLVKRYPERIISIDGNQPIQKVIADVNAHLNAFFSSDKG